MKTLSAAVITFAAATPAFAQNAVPWEMKPGEVHVVDMQRRMRVIPVNDKGMMTALIRRARPVPRGMAFFMNNGVLYMTQAPRSLFESNF
jgi:hypothetical protein